MPAGKENTKKKLVQFSCDNFDNYCWAVAQPFFFKKSLEIKPNRFEVSQCSLN